MTIVDTNYLVRLFTKTPPNMAKQVVAELESAQPDSIYLPDYVLSELMYVLAFHHQLSYARDQIFEGIRLILTHPSWRYDRLLHDKALDIYDSTKLDYVDCLVIAEYKLNRATKVMSFDKQLLKTLSK